MIKVIVFDAQGTLFSSLSKNEKIQSILKSQGYDKSIAEINSAFLLSKKITNLLHLKGMIKLDKKGYLLENEIRFMLLGFEDKKATALAKIANEQWTVAGNRKLYPEVIRVLNSLKNKYKLGILTAGAAISYNETLKQTGISDYFAFVIGEDTTNVPKPDARAYRKVIVESGCKANEILFVGDDFINDYEGPKKSGMHAVLVDRKGEYKNNVMKIDDLQPLSTDKFFNSL